MNQFTMLYKVNHLHIPLYELFLVNSSGIVFPFDTDAKERVQKIL